MPIYAPGIRDRRKKIKATKKDIVATLQLTAMVDMFTVLVVFLLQNYASTNQILPISESVALPKATSIEKLNPSLVVVVSKEKLTFNGKDIISFDELRSQKEWLVPTLRQKVFEVVEKKKKDDRSKILSMGDSEDKKEKIFPYERLTLQADENIDFLTIKKVMYTLTEAGIKEINFAVIRIKEYPS